VTSLFWEILGKLYPEGVKNFSLPIDCSKTRAFRSEGHRVYTWKMSSPSTEGIESIELQGVVKALHSVTPPVRFSTSLTFSAADFKVEVDEFGEIGAAVSEKVIRGLIKASRLASFGWRDQTVVDTRVRNVWEIPANNLKIGGTEFAEQLNEGLKTIQKDLGIAEQGELRAKLHNLLIYEPGQFFSTHQDTEKVDGMVATMTVVLPTAFEGGTLIVDHHGEKKKYPAPKEKNDRLNIVAFYADCQHEVGKVTSGYRITLTYNLKLEAKGVHLPGQRNKKLSDSIQKYFQARSSGEGSEWEVTHPRWLVYLLDYHYTEKGLGWLHLKGSDRIRAAEFRGAASELGLSIHLALSELHETWQAEEEYSRGSRYGRYRYREEAENEEVTLDDLTLVDLLEEEYTLVHWINENGESENIKPHYLSREMFCWSKATDAFEPFKTEYEGYMGNYGNTADRWYHRAAIILWRKEDEFASSFAMDANGTLRKIRKVLVEDRQAGVALLEKVLPQWRRLQSPKSEGAKDLFEVCLLVKDNAFSAQLLAILNLNALAPPENLRSFVGLVELYGEPCVVDVLKKWAKAERFQREGIVNLPFLCEHLLPFRQVITWLLNFQFGELIASDKHAEKQDSQVDIAKAKKQVVRKAAEFVEACELAKDQVVFSKAIEHILTHQRVYPPLTVADLILHCERRPVCREWNEFISEVVERLRTVAEKPRERNDFSIYDHIPCKCQDCKVLSNFLRNKEERKLVWPLAEARRQHIHQIIDGMGTGVSHETQRSGSPYKLILSKLDQHFEKEEKNRQRAVNLLRSGKLASKAGHPKN
jgi:hypothetical protein